MKKIIWAVSIFCMSLSVHAQDDRYYDNSNSDDVYNNDNYNEQDQDANSGQSYQAFYDDLNPYGSWINTPQYGYVWVPLQAGAGFSPYATNGHWVYTQYGWTWVSDFEWGWATFHYGRWYQDPGYGWMWMPGSEWAPAWVVWGSYDNYYCWAPVGPGEYISSHYGDRDHHWNFVDHGHITDGSLSNYVVSNTVRRARSSGFQQHISVISHVSTFNRSVFFSGPRSNEVEKATGQKIQKVSIAPVDKAGPTRVSGSQVQIYRPDIRAAATARQNAAPAHISRAEDLPRNTGGGNNSQPQRTEPQRTEPQRSSPAEPQRPQPTQWTPPRQSMPRSEPAPQAQPRQSAPIERGGGGFVPSARPSSPPPMRQSSPPPMRSSGGGHR